MTDVVPPWEEKKIAQMAAVARALRQGASVAYDAHDRAAARDLYRRADVAESRARDYAARVSVDADDRASGLFDSGRPML